MTDLTEKGNLFSELNYSTVYDKEVKILFILSKEVDKEQIIKEKDKKEEKNQFDFYQIVCTIF
ncbi:MAG: hypothetical protein QG670_2302 [Thermoproteota archaeon]|nr:hypothetical protein [Thermoproteota archaeon]